MEYTGELVMPTSYAVMDEEEMAYTEGGKWKVNTLWKNIVGAAGQWSVIKSIAKAVKVGGKSVWTWALKGVAWTQRKAVSMLAAFCAKVGIKMSTVSRLVGIIVAVSAAYAVYRLGSQRIFY